tara:strand:+ start:438 stop:632 length:195 start_codon:yes stop_codon:yes gene_type:complete
MYNKTIIRGIKTKLKYLVFIFLEKKARDITKKITYKRPNFSVGVLNIENSGKYLYKYKYKLERG